MIKGDVKVFKLDRDAYLRYKTEVKGCENISFKQAQLKLSRNIHLGIKKVKLKNLLKGQQVFLYGHLKIIVKDEEIIDIENHTKDAIPGWKCDENEYIRVSKALGIRDNKFSKKRKAYVK